MIGIVSHRNDQSFSKRWIEYCENQCIKYKVIDCYKNDVIDQIKNCDIIMWHHHHMSPKDILFAKQLLFSLEHSGKIVFPDFKTNWHFDDKLGQKYLLESMGMPLVPSYIFYTKKEAYEWISKAIFPKVFKLRRGAGSWNVSLINNKRNALKVLNIAFGKGFRQYRSFPVIKEQWRKYNLGLIDSTSMLKTFLRIVKEPEYSANIGRERGYVYFQDYIENNDCDIRVIVIYEKAFAIKRINRKNDFKASGSGNISYEKNNFNDATIRLSFDLAKKLQTQCVAFDYVYQNEKPLVVEISYGFSAEVYDPCVGYWDKNMNWYEGRFNPYAWMVDGLLKSV